MYLQNSAPVLQNEGATTGEKLKSTTAMASFHIMRGKSKSTIFNTDNYNNHARRPTVELFCYLVLSNALMTSVDHVTADQHAVCILI